jgi:hypothetical protein
MATNTALNPANYYQYQPPDYNAAAQAMLDQAPKFAKQNFQLQKQYSPKYAQLAVDTNAKYAPQNTKNYLDVINQADPEFLKVRNALGSQVEQGLKDGYSLGDGLSDQVEQDARAAQSARGNWYGPAPTADEAFQKASARINLYNQRQQAATNFLQSRGAGDILAQYSQTMPYAPSASIPSIPAQTINQVGGAISQANQLYQNQFDNFLYNTSVANGLYNPMNSGVKSGSGAAGMATGILGGAASGAAMGAMTGNPYGIAAGAIIGGAMGAFASSQH